MSFPVNAVLTQVESATPGSVDEYGDPVGTGTVLWQGRAAGYLKRVRRQVVSQATVATTRGDSAVLVMLKQDTLTILDHQGGAELAAAVVAGGDWENSRVTIEDRRLSTPVTRVFDVIGAEHRQAGTVVDSLRIELDQETPAA